MKTLEEEYIDDLTKDIMAAKQRSNSCLMIIFLLVTLACLAGVWIGLHG